MESSVTTSHKKLTIIIGAQKGLCAVFNTQLYNAVQRAFEQESTATDIIIVGKKMIDALEKETISSIVTTYPQLTQNTIHSIAQDIATRIRTAVYRTVHVWSNQQKNFFIQLPHKTVVLPISSDSQNTHTTITEEYWWPENPRIILDQLWILYITTQLQSLLLESLAAEQAARFVAMHSATHNAQQLIDTMRLDYNKLRQAKITSELADLSASF